MCRSEAKVAAIAGKSPVHTRAIFARGGIRGRSFLWAGAAGRRVPRLVRQSQSSVPCAWAGPGLFPGNDGGTIGPTSVLYGLLRLSAIALVFNPPPHA